MLSRRSGIVANRLRCRARPANLLCKQPDPLRSQYTVRTIVTARSRARIAPGSLERCFNDRHVLIPAVQFSSAKGRKARPAAIIKKEENENEPSHQDETDGATKRENGDNGIWQCASDVLKEVDQEKTEFVGAKEVEANFQSIRSTFQAGDKLDLRQWRELRLKLQEGFTGAQLTDYISQSKQEPTVSEDAEATKCLDNWRPGISKYIELTANPPKWISDGLRSIKGVTGKGLLAEQVMRDCWLLSVQDEMGQVDLRMGPQQLILLMGHNGTQLRDLSKKYNAKVDVSRVLNIVRITGTETVCHDLRGALLDLLSKTRSKTVKLIDEQVVGGHKEMFHTEFYEFLEKHYGVFCEKDSKTKTLKIYYMEDAEPKAEEFRRSVELALAHPYEYIGPFTSYTPPPTPAVFIPVANPDALPWQNRNTQYLRWLKGSLRQNEKSGTKYNMPQGPFSTELPTRLFDKSLEPPILHVISNALFGDGDYHSIYSRSLRHVREVVTASPGKCLMRHRTGIKGGIFKWRQLERKVARRVFTTDIPNLRYFLQRQKVVPSSKEAIRLRLRLTPSAAQKLPPVELELDADPWSDRDPKAFKPVIRSARAILDEKSIDLLMPDFHHDLKFKNIAQYDFFKGGNPTILTEDDKNDPSISSILECVRNLPYAAPMPVSCHLTIPGKLLKCENEEKRPESVTAEYFFSALRSVSSARTGRFVYNDFELNYTHLGAGPVFASQNDDLTLFLNRHDAERRPANLHELGGLLTGENLQRAFATFYPRACRIPFDISNIRPPTADGFGSDIIDKPIRRRPAPDPTIPSPPIRFIR